MDEDFGCPGFGRSAGRCGNGGPFVNHGRGTDQAVNFLCASCLRRAQTEQPVHNWPEGQKCPCCHVDPSKDGAHQVSNLTTADGKSLGISCFWCHKVWSDVLGRKALPVGRRQV